MPRLWGILLSLTRGVFPICSVTEFITTGGSFGLLIVDILNFCESDAEIEKINRDSGDQVDAVIVYCELEKRIVAEWIIDDPCNLIDRPTLADI